VQAVDGLIAGAVAARPDLRAAQAQAQAAAARVRSARSDLLPTLSVSGSTGRLWTDGADDPTNRTSGALTLSIPLFGGFSGRHELARARAEADAAVERARGFEQRVVYEIFVAHSDFLTATERVRTADELLASAEASEQVALGRYREGVGDILDLLSAQRALATARAQRINARLGWFTSLAQLARDAGVLGLRGANPLAPDNLHPEVTR
jgi:outer membrane protein TolC